MQMTRWFRTHCSIILPIKQERLPRLGQPFFSVHGPGPSNFLVAGFMTLLSVAPEPRRILITPFSDPLRPDPEYRVDDQQHDDAY